MLGFNPKSVAAMLENIIYFELRRKGYEVYIGKNETKEIFLKLHFFCNPYCKKGRISDKIGAINPMIALFRSFCLQECLCLPAKLDDLDRIFSEGGYLYVLCPVSA